MSLHTATLMKGIIMAIRIRKVNGTTVALCAAKTLPVKDDVYLDDNAHYALSTKFHVDWVEEGIITIEEDLADEEIKRLMLDLEKNQNPHITSFLLSFMYERI